MGVWLLPVLLNVLIENGSFLFKKQHPNPGNHKQQMDGYKVLDHYIWTQAQQYVVGQISQGSSLLR